MNYYIKNKSNNKEDSKKSHRKNYSVIVGLQDQQGEQQQSFNSYKNKIRNGSEHNLSFNHNSLMDKKDKNQFFLQEIQECINYFDGKTDKIVESTPLINTNTVNASKQCLDSQNTRDYSELIDEIKQLKDQTNSFRQMFLSQSMQIQEQSQMNKFLQKEVIRIKYQQQQTQQIVESQNQLIESLKKQLLGINLKDQKQQCMKGPKHKKNKSNVFINPVQQQQTVLKQSYFTRMFNNNNINDDRLMTQQNNQCLSYMDIPKSLFDK